jgi:arylsulfatase A-like enzyme
VLLLGCCSIGCSVGRPADPVPDYTSLARLAEEQEVLQGNRLVEYVWNLGGDHRAALFQHPPGRVRLGPIPAGVGCKLRFAIGINTPAWEHSDGVTFRLHRTSERGQELLYEETLEPAKLPGPAWLDREVELSTPESSLPDASFDLVLETGPGPAGSRVSDHAAWATAHVSCPRPTPEPAQLERPHIVMISLDTLRPDHLGLSGYFRDTSPNLDALATEALIFENAFSPAPWTLPSHASMFTGHYPASHRAGYSDSLDALDDRLPTLAETLRDAGYRTLAFVGGGLLSASNGLDRGFDSWNEHIKANLASQLPRIFDAIGQRPDRPLFLFIHTYDIHGPYHEMPSTHGFEPEPSDDPEDVARADQDWERIRELDHHHYQKFERFGSLAQVVAAYDAGIRTTDTVLGRIFDRLRELGLYDQALILVTSDHGESLYDRGLFVGHGFTLYDEDLRVPLIVRLPGGSEAGRRPELVDLVDLMPLVLDVAGVEVPGALQGASPLDRESGKAAPKEFVAGETVFSGARFQRSLDWKLVTAPHPLDDPASRVPPALQSRFKTGEQAFDLRSDPGEERNLLAAGRPPPSEVEELRGLAGGREAPGTGIFDPGKLDPRRAEELRGLGYLE